MLAALDAIRRILGGPAEDTMLIHARAVPEKGMTDGAPVPGLVGSAVVLFLLLLLQRMNVSLPSPPLSSPSLSLPLPP